MRAREVGGYEPDDREQNELHELFFMARGVAFAGKNTAELIAKHGSVRGAQIAWVVDAFLKAHAGEPNVVRKWVYNWCVERLGIPFEPDRSAKRISDVVPAGDLRVCANCQLPRLMHNTAMTDCETFTTKRSK